MPYVLDDGEVIILREDKATVGSDKNVCVLLTNKRIIKIVHDFWGSESDHYFALSKLRESNGNPNVRIGKGSNGKQRLELYFEKSQQFITFPGFMAEQKWASAITKAYKARMKEIAKAEREPISVSAIFAPLKDKIDAAKEKIDSAKEAHFQRDKQPVSLKCPECGAIVSGYKGEEAKCEYCEYVFVIR